MLDNFKFDKNIAIHNHNTRNKSKIHQPVVKHEYAKHCLRFDLPSTVNNFPDLVLDKIHTHSLSGFSGYVKQYILNTYQQSCLIVNCYMGHSRIRGKFFLQAVSLLMTNIF